MVPRMREISGSEEISLMSITRSLPVHVMDDGPTCNAVLALAQGAGATVGHRETPAFAVGSHVDAAVVCSGRRGLTTRTTARILTR